MPEANNVDGRRTAGLLICDHLDSDVAAAIGGDYDTRLFPELLAPLGYEIVPFEATKGHLPTSPSECDVWITTGSRFSSMDDDGWILALGDFLVQIVKSGRPLVAVCFGHQLLARMLGGSVEEASGGWGVGVKTFSVVEPPAWMDSIDDEFDVLVSHRDQVVVPPPGARVVASAPYCPVGAYLIGDNVFALQGHPEFVGALSERLIERRRQLLGDKVADDGLATLESKWDAGGIRSSVVDFLAWADRP